MKRPKYKSMYQEEKIKKELFINLLNKVIDNLKTFDLNIEDREQDSEYSLKRLRQVLIQQDDLHRFYFYYDKEIEK